MSGRSAAAAAPCIVIFGGGTLFLLSLSPVGKAFAERLRRHGTPEPDPEILAELDSLRQEVGELQERMDFTERLLARQREPERLEG